MVSPQIILLRLTKLAKNISFELYALPFGNTGKYTQMSPRAFLMFSNFYFQLLIGEYERDFSLFNFFFGILKHFLKCFNPQILFPLWNDLLSTTYTNIILKYARLWFPECWNIDDSRRKIFLKCHLGKVKITLNKELRGHSGTPTKICLNPLILTLLPSAWYIVVCCMNK